MSVLVQAAQVAPVLGAAAHVVSAPVNASASPAQHLRAHQLQQKLSQVDAVTPVDLSVANTSYTEYPTPCGFAYTHGKPRKDLPKQIGASVATFISFATPGMRSCPGSMTCHICTPSTAAAVARIHKLLQKPSWCWRTPSESKKSIETAISVAHACVTHGPERVYICLT